MCTLCVTATLQSQKRASEPLEMKLQIVLQHHMGAGKEQLVLFLTDMLSPFFCCYCFTIQAGLELTKLLTIYF